MEGHTKSTQSEARYSVENWCWKYIIKLVHTTHRGTLTRIEIFSVQMSTRLDDSEIVNLV